MRTETATEALRRRAQEMAEGVRADAASAQVHAERAGGNLDAETLAFASRDDDSLDAAGANGLPSHLTVVGAPLAPRASSTPSEVEFEVSPFERELRRALADVRAKLGTDAKKERQRLFLDATSLFQRDFAATSWLVTGLVTRGGIAMIGAEPKATKTWLGTELAVSIATGTKVCGEFYACHGVVAYFYAEDLDKQVRNRLRALLAARDLESLPVGRLHVQPRGEFLDITVDEDLAWIVASVRLIGPIDLLVLDPLRDVHSGEEDKSDSMRNVMRRLRLLGELLSCTVAVVHHMAKMSKDTSTRTAGQKLRGSSAIHGSIDSGIYLIDTNGDGQTTFVNSIVSQVKGGKSAGFFKLKLEVTDDENGEAEHATWTVLRDVPLKQTAKATQETMDDDRTFAWVRELAMRAEHLSRRGLRGHDERPADLPEPRVRKALDRLLETGRLELRGSGVWIPEPKQGRES